MQACSIAKCLFGNTVGGRDYVLLMQEAVVLKS